MVDLLPGQWLVLSGAVGVIVPLSARAEGAGVPLGASWEEGLDGVVVCRQGHGSMHEPRPDLLAERGIDDDASASYRPRAGASVDDAVGPQGLCG